LVCPSADRLVFLPDGKTLATTNRGALWLWDFRSGKLRRRFEPPLIQGVLPTPIRALACSPDSKLLAAGCDDQVVRLWETATGRQVASIRGKVRVGHAAFSPDGKRLAIWGYPGPIEIREVASGKLLATTPHLATVVSLVFTAEGKALLSAHREAPNWSRSFTWWDPATGKELRRSKGAPLASWSGALGPGGGLFAAPTQDGKTIRLLDPHSGKEVVRTEGEASSPYRFAFSGDGRLLTSNSTDGTIRVWDTATGKVRHRIRLPKGRFIHVALSLNGKVLAVSSWRDHEILLFDVSSGCRLHSFPGHRSGIVTITFAPDGKHVFTTSREPSHSSSMQDLSEWSLRRWDAATGKELRVTRANPGGEVHYTVFSPDGRLLATITHNCTLRLWDVSAGKELRRWKVLERFTAVRSGQMVTRLPWPAVTQPVFSADGKILLAASEKQVHRWDIATGKELPPVAHGLEAMYPRCFATADNRTVLLGASERTTNRLVLFDLDSGKAVRVYPAGRSYLQAVAVSPDGRTLAFAEGRIIRLLEVESGQERGHFLGDSDFVFALEFSADGRLLAAAGHRDNVIRVWRLPSGEPQRLLTGLENRIYSLSFAPDGRRLASAGYTNTALVWDVADLLKGEADVPAKLTQDQLEALGDKLASVDGTAAYRAICRLAETPAQSVPFLRARLKARPAPDPRRIARLISDLESDKFKVRQKASAELARLGSHAQPALRRALAGKPTLEVRSRIERLLRHIEQSATAGPSQELVGLRILEALEKAGTAEARQVLAEVAKGDAEARWVREARAALQRLTRMP
jgi:WD40 repeat protein